MIPAKLTAQLSETLDKTQADDLIELIIELGGVAKPKLEAGMDRTARIAAKKEAFAQAAKPVAEEIERLGGTVLDQAWLIGALKARVSPRMVDALTEQAQVAKLDQPHKIEPEVG